MIVGILGILKAGGAYVPIDPDYPEDRIKYIFDDTNADVIISSSESSLKFKDFEKAKVFKIDSDWSVIKKQSTDNLGLKLDPKQLAYVIYTSGSTGRPKGVLIEHFNVVRLFKTDPPLFDFNQNDVWTMFHSFCFDFSVWEMFGALLFGGRLVLINKDATKDADQYSEILVREEVTVLNQTPSAFYILQDVMTESKKPFKVRYVIFGGEALNPAKLLAWKETYPECRLINM
jgi:non-ribosomal peptide synthetase component F